jgi:MFS family permease
MDRYQNNRKLPAPITDFGIGLWTLDELRDTGRLTESTPPSVFGLPEFRYLLTAVAAATLAGQALLLVVRFQVYEISKSPLSLGMLGLVEAIPALSLVLFGGHVADRYDRRRILQATTAMLALCAIVLAIISVRGMSLPALYATVFVVGIARSFSAPAHSALEAQVVPVQLIVKSATWFASTWLIASVVGPIVGGDAYDRFGAVGTYLLIAGLYAMACFGALQISPKPSETPHEDESIWQSIRAGVSYVVGDQILLGSMALDLFAVLFGGAIAILPIFAADILHVDTAHLGMLTAAPNAGALLTMLIATRHPPVRHAGRNLLLAVAGFGVSMLVFAVSKNFYLSLVALFLSGVFDGISVVIRKSIVRLLSPNYLRGRIAAVSLIFIGSSNELGALESGLAAAWLGTVPSVLAGGTITLLIAGFTTLLAPRLRTLRLDRVPESKVTT